MTLRVVAKALAIALSCLLIAVGLLSIIIELTKSSYDPYGWEPTGPLIISTCVILFGTTLLTQLFARNLQSLPPIVKASLKLLVSIAAGIFIFFFGIGLWAFGEMMMRESWVGSGLHPAGLVALAAVGCWGVSIIVFIISVADFVDSVMKLRATRSDRKQVLGVY